MWQTFPTNADVDDVDLEQGLEWTEEQMFVD